MSYLMSEAANSVYKTPLWSDSLTANHIHKSAESMLSVTMERITQYNVWRTGLRKWQVNFKNWSNSGGSHHPVFKHIRNVELNDSEFLVCSCCHWKICGLPCVHVAAVLQFEVSDWQGFGRNDVDICWWNLYQCFAYDKRKRSTVWSSYNSKTSPNRWPKVSQGMEN